MLLLVQLANNQAGASIFDIIITFVPLAIVVTLILLYMKYGKNIKKTQNDKPQKIRSYKAIVPVIFLALFFLFALLDAKVEKGLFVFSYISLGMFVSSIFGLICEKIMGSKGYPIDENNGFWWGFFLNLIGIIICAVQLPYSLSQKGITQNRYQNSNAEPYRPVKQKSESMSSQIKELKELLDQGLITEEEYDAKKKQLLGL